MSFLSKQRIWPIGIIATLFLFVCFEIGLVVMASRTFEGPDDVHYYKMGLEYSREVERQKHQRHNGWQLEILQQVPLRCRMLDRQGHPLSGEMKVCCKRPATQTQDQTLEILHQGQDYVGSWRPDRGKWLIDFNFESEGQIYRRRLHWIMP